jgi:hypothetical protein
MTGTATTEAGDFGRFINWMWLKFRPTDQWQQDKEILFSVRENSTQ